MADRLPSVGLFDIFSSLGEKKNIALAISGGSDSIALLLLAKEWASSLGASAPRLLALTVDHGLRDESAAEVAFVAAQCAALGVPHQGLRWQRASDTGNLSANAREGRYRLMAQVARDRGAQVLLTGHTKDDQAETVLMRLARGSGVDGLVAMPYVTHSYGTELHRPLLGFSKAELRGYLRAENVGWCEDPTNDDDAYHRVKARRLLEAGGELGLSAGRLTATADRMRMAQLVLEDAADALAVKAVTPKRQGYFELCPPAFAEAREETALRLLARLLGSLSGEAYRPALKSCQALLNALIFPEKNQRATLHGCRIVHHDAGAALMREVAACPPSGPLRVGDWDARFSVKSTSADQKLSIAPLSERGWAQIAQKSDVNQLRSIPYAARLALPALWRGDYVVAVPSEHIWFDASEKTCVIEPRPPFERVPVEPSLGMLI